MELSKKQLKDQCIDLIRQNKKLSAENKQLKTDIDNLDILVNRMKSITGKRPGSVW